MDLFLWYLMIFGFLFFVDSILGCVVLVTNTDGDVQRDRIRVRSGVRGQPPTSMELPILRWVHDAYEPDSEPAPRMWLRATYPLPTHHEMYHDIGQAPSGRCRNPPVHHSASDEPCPDVPISSLSPSLF